MEIGRPVRIHIVEPLEDPVPKEAPAPAEPAPAEPAPAGAPAP